MDITGKTAMMLMLADPVSHIRGTILINKALEKLGIDAAIVPIQVAPEDLGQAVDAVRRLRNVVGLGITIPHKIAVVPLLDGLTAEASRAGAVNFIRRMKDGSLQGTNTDGAGFLAGLSANGISPAGRQALVIGAGGVARAICFSLAEAGISRLTVINRAPGKAEALCADVRAAFPGLQVVPGDAQDLPGDHGLIVNATSLGMAPTDPMPIGIGKIRRGHIVADVVVNPPMTPLLSAAASIGCKVVPGPEMLKPQPALIAQFFGLLQ